MINLVKIYFFTSMIIVLLYNLNFSFKYESLDIFNYLIDIFFIILILPSYFMVKKINPLIKEIRINTSLTIVILLNCLEYLYTKKIPLIEIILNTGYSYREYEGIPIFHVLIFQYSIYVSMLAGYNMVLLKNKKNIIKYILSLLPMVLVYSRFGVILSIFTTLNIFIFFNIKNIKKYLIQIFLFIILGSYIFGVTGNIRSGYRYNENQMILSIGGATDQFKNSILPKEFFWVYVYLTSSLANFQATVKEIQPLNSKKNYWIQAIYPVFISKRLTNDSRKEFSQISTALNGAPDYTFPYIYLGWEGVVIFILLKSLFVNIYSLIVVFGKKENILLNLSLLNCFIFFNFINNFFLYGGFILLPLYGIVYSFKKIKIKKRKEIR